jgi:2-amino-4-hydroxy-6-hydroxymethyldihydropteridine diphosphokinase
MSRVFIGIGSNEGDRLESISSALKALGAAAGIRVVQMAVVSETDPVGGPAQGPYLNTVAEIVTSLSPRGLLATLQGIERQLGRSPSSERLGPRVIDLDILRYDDCLIQEPDLCVPHPRMHERRFVLEPLIELTGENFVHPVLRRSLKEFLEKVKGQECDKTTIEL